MRKINKIQINILAKLALKKSIAKNMPTNIKNIDALSPERIIRIKADAIIKKNKI
jgi:hypothetical protein